MSNFLVRASLELLDTDNNLNKDKKRKKNRSKGVLDLIPVNQRITKKGKTSTIIQKSSKLTVHEAKKQIQQFKDPTDDNVQKLLALSGNKIASEVADMLFERALKKRAPSKPEKRVVEEPQSVFTEEDFEDFEKSYFGL